MDIKALRQELEVVLQDLLGEYVLPNDQVIPAVAVLKNFEIYPPDGSTVSGLELVINENGDRIGSHRFENYGLEQQVTLYLKNWEKTWSASQNLKIATNKILQIRTLYVKRVMLLPLNEEMGSPEQVTLECLDFYTGGDNAA